MNHYIGVFFESSVLKEVYILSYLHINDKLLILKSKDKFSELVLLFGRLSYILSFRHCSIFLLYKWIFFKKTQNLSRGLSFYCEPRIFTISQIDFIKWEQSNNLQLCRQWLYKWYKVYKVTIEIHTEKQGT